jgi:thiol:disulfide interchange protein
MTIRKIFGFAFIVVAIILALLIVGQFSKLFIVFVGVFKAFRGQLDSYQVGQVIGTLIYWICHIALTVLLWTIGRRWIKDKRRSDE